MRLMSVTEWTLSVALGGVKEMLRLDLALSTRVS